MYSLYWSSCTIYIGLHVQYSLFLSDFNETSIFPTDFLKKPKYQISLKNASSGSRVVPWGRAEGRTDRRTDRHDETNSRFSKFCKSPKIAVLQKRDDHCNDLFRFIWCPARLIWCPARLIWCPARLIWCPARLIWCPVRLIWCPVRLIAMATAKRNYELKLTNTYSIFLYPVQ